MRWRTVALCTIWSKYMAQSPKGRFVHGLHKPVHGDCASYFYSGVDNYI